MRKVLQLVLVGASVLAAMASATSNQGYGTPSHEPGVNADESVPPLVRHQVVRPGVIGDVRLVAIPAGVSAWNLKITNNTPGLVTVSWDESTFVTNDGQSQGRLIRGETRRMDTGKAQPQTPIAPGSSIIETVFPERMLDGEQTEANIEKMDYLTHQQVLRFIKLRDAIQASIVDGKLVVTIDIGGTKSTWTGVVESTDAPRGSAAHAPTAQQAEGSATTGSAGSGLEQP
jgi:hypothetical protein